MKSKRSREIDSESDDSSYLSIESKKIARDDDISEPMVTIGIR